jgi:hypothetical protein
MHLAVAKMVVAKLVATKSHIFSVEFEHKLWEFGSSSAHQGIRRLIKIFWLTIYSQRFIQSESYVEEVER